MTQPKFHSIDERRLLLRKDDLERSPEEQTVLKTLRSGLVYDRECHEGCCPYLGTVTVEGHDFDVFWNQGPRDLYIKVQFGNEPWDYSYWALAYPALPHEGWSAIKIGRLVYDYLRAEEPT